jgi:hypothetical protein
MMDCTNPSAYEVGAVPFGDGRSLVGDMLRLVWDRFMFRMGINVATPVCALHVRDGRALGNRDASTPVIRVDSGAAVNGEASLGFGHQDSPALQAWISCNSGGDLVHRAHRRQHFYAGDGSGASKLTLTTDNALGAQVRSSRFQEVRGASLAVVSKLVLGEGNLFEVTGTGAADCIDTTNWQGGARVTLYCSGAVTFNHMAGSPPASSAKLKLRTGAATVVTDACIDFRYDDVRAWWVQV